VLNKFSYAQVVYAVFENFYRQHMANCYST